MDRSTFPPLLWLLPFCPAASFAVDLMARAAAIASQEYGLY
jgi:hypothetical protein